MPRLDTFISSLNDIDYVIITSHGSLVAWGAISNFLQLPDLSCSKGKAGFYVDRGLNLTQITVIPF